MSSNEIKVLDLLKKLTDEQHIKVINFIEAMLIEDDEAQQREQEYKKVNDLITKAAESGGSLHFL